MAASPEIQCCDYMHAHPDLVQQVRAQMPPEEQLYDLAKIQHAPLLPEAMTKFVARSNEIMMMLAK